MSRVALVLVLSAGAAGCDVFALDLQVSSVEVTDDDNDDGRLNPGEHARLRLRVSGWNSSTGSVNGTLSSASDLVVVEDRSTYMTSAGSEVRAGSFDVGVSPDAEVGTDIVFDLALEYSSSGGSDSGAERLSFSVPIVATGAEPVVEAVEVTEDSNGDGIPNKGEALQVRIHLHNAGSSSLPDCDGVLLSAGPYVTVLRDTVDFDDVAAGETKTGWRTYELAVDQAAPAGHEAALSLQVRDALSNVWTLPVPLTIQATGARVVYSRLEVTDDDDDDGLAEADESVELKVWLKNAGTSRALDVEAVLSANDALLSLQGDTPQGDYSDIDPGEEAGGWRGFRMDLAPETPAGHAFELFLTITDAQANSWTDSFTLTEGASTLDLVLEEADVTEVSGDGDGRLAPGEVGRIAITVRNRGGETAREVRAELSTDDQHVRIDAGRVRVGAVGPGGTAPGEGTFQFTVLASHPGGSIPFSVTLTAGNYVVSRSLEVSVGGG